MQVDAVAFALRELAQARELTVWQAELLVLFCAGLSRFEVRTRLYISENTLKTRIRMLCRQLDTLGATMEDVVRNVHRRAAQTAQERASEPQGVPEAPLLVEQARKVAPAQVPTQAKHPPAPSRKDPLSVVRDTLDAGLMAQPLLREIHVFPPMA